MTDLVSEIEQHCGGRQMARCDRKLLVVPRHTRDVSIHYFDFAPHHVAADVAGVCLQHTRGDPSDSNDRPRSTDNQRKTPSPTHAFDRLRLRLVTSLTTSQTRD